VNGPKTGRLTEDSFLEQETAACLLAVLFLLHAIVPIYPIGVVLLFLEKERITMLNEPVAIPDQPQSIHTLVSWRKKIYRFILEVRRFPRLTNTTSC
jgi:hypothetical protein